MRTDAELSLEINVENLQMQKLILEADLKITDTEITLEESTQRITDTEINLKKKNEFQFPYLYFLISSKNPKFCFCNWKTIP